MSSRNYSLKKINFNIIGLSIALILILIIFSFLNQYFFSYSNFINILLAITVFGIAAIAQTSVVISGGLDLSQEAVIVASGVIVAMLSQKGIPLVISISAGMLIGPLVGFINGVVITKLKINPIITTLATLAIVRSLILEISGSKTISIKNDAFLFLGTGRILGKIPISIIILILVYLLFYFLLGHTVFGRRIYAVGGNSQASMFAGLKIDRIKIVIYMISGTAAALGGLILSSITRYGIPHGASGIIFRIFAAVFLGGTALGGGRGKVAGTFLAILILGTISNGLVMINIGLAAEDIFISLILLFSVMLSQRKFKASN